MDTRKIVRFLKQYGQQQSFETIREALNGEPEQDDMAKLVESGKVVEVSGGVDSRGMEVTHYMAADDAEDDDET